MAPQLNKCVRQPFSTTTWSFLICSHYSNWHPRLASLWRRWSKGEYDFFLIKIIIEYSKLKIFNEPIINNFFFNIVSIDWPNNDQIASFSPIRWWLQYRALLQRHCRCPTLGNYQAMTGSGWGHLWLWGGLCDGDFKRTYLFSYFLTYIFRKM